MLFTYRLHVWFTQTLMVVSIYVSYYYLSIVWCVVFLLNYINVRGMSLSAWGQPISFYLLKTYHTLKFRLNSGLPSPDGVNETKVHGHNSLEGDVGLKYFGDTLLLTKNHLLRVQIIHFWLISMTALFRSVLPWVFAPFLCSLLCCVWLCRLFTTLRVDLSLSVSYSER